MTRYDAVLFDFDGTVFDTFEGIAVSMRETMHELFGAPRMELSEYRKFCGPPLKDCFRMLGCKDEEELTRACAHYRELYRRDAVAVSRPFEGMPEALGRMKSAGVRLGIASSKADYVIAASLEHSGMTDVFEVISATPPDERVISKKDLILNGMKALGIADRGRVAMCGDRFYDAEGARQAGVDFIAAAYGFAPEGELERLPHVLSAQNAREIADFVLGGD